MQSGNGTLILEFDGLCAPAGRGAVAAYGWLIRRGAAVVNSGSGTHPVRIPHGYGPAGHRAEYHGLIEGLQAVIQVRRPAEPLTVRGDARLVIRQMAGLWCAVGPALAPSYRQACELTRPLYPVTFVLVAPEHNAAADALARAACRTALEVERRARAVEVHVERVSGGRYRANGKYDVDSTAGTCTCPDYINLCHRFHARCKHLFALEGHTLDE